MNQSKTLQINLLYRRWDVISGHSDIFSGQLQKVLLKFSRSMEFRQSGPDLWVNEQPNWKHNSLSAAAVRSAEARQKSKLADDDSTC